MSYHLDRAVDRVKGVVEEIAPFLLPCNYVVYGGVFRSFLEGNVPKDIDLCIQDDGRGPVETLRMAGAYGAPSVDLVLGAKCKADITSAGFWSHPKINGLDTFIFHHKRAAAVVLGRAPATVCGCFSTDYSGRLVFPDFATDLLPFIDLVVAAAVLGFTVKPGGSVDFGILHIPPGFEDAVQNRQLWWRPKTVAFRLDKIARLHRYILEYGYKFPDRETFDTVCDLLKPEPADLNIWLLHNPHLR